RPTPRGTAINSRPSSMVAAAASATPPTSDRNIPEPLVPWESETKILLRDFFDESTGALRYDVVVQRVGELSEALTQWQRAEPAEHTFSTRAFSSDIQKALTDAERILNNALETFPSPHLMSTHPSNPVIASYILLKTKFGAQKVKKYDDLLRLHYPKLLQCEVYAQKHDVNYPCFAELYKLTEILPEFSAVLMRARGAPSGLFSPAENYHQWCQKKWAMMPLTELVRAGCVDAALADAVAEKMKAHVALVEPERTCVEKQYYLAELIKLGAKTGKFDIAVYEASAIKMMWPEVAFENDQHRIFSDVVKFLETKLVTEIDKTFVVADDVRDVRQTFDAKHKYTEAALQQIFSALLPQPIAPNAALPSQLGMLHSKFFSLSEPILGGMEVTQALKIMALNLLENQPINAIAVKLLFSRVGFSYVWVGGEGDCKTWCSLLRAEMVTQDERAPLCAQLITILGKATHSLALVDSTQPQLFLESDCMALFNVILKPNDVIQDMENALRAIWEYPPIQKAIKKNPNGTLTFLSSPVAQHLIDDPKTNLVKKYGPAKALYTLLQDVIQNIVRFQDTFKNIEYDQREGCTRTLSQIQTTAGLDVMENQNNCDAKKLMAYASIEAGFDQLVAKLKEIRDGLGAEKNKTFGALIQGALEAMEAARTAWDTRVAYFLNLSELISANRSAMACAA
ncbi:MAG TPA: hypothetical protein VI844_01545, partial [Coxiellaceae bacterium]|nr:hypothetical protein [Coxiellaceae bacterium]